MVRITRTYTPTLTVIVTIKKVYIDTNNRIIILLDEGIALDTIDQQVMCVC